MRSDAMAQHTNKRIHDEKSCKYKRNERNDLGYLLLLPNHHFNSQTEIRGLLALILSEHARFI